MEKNAEGSWTEKRTNVSIGLLMEFGHARGNISLRQRAAKQKMMFFNWPCDASNRYGKG